MRTDLTVLGADDTSRDVAVFARRGATWRDVRPLLGARGRWCSDGRPLCDSDELGGPLLRDGVVLCAGAASFQCVPKNTWPDGSMRFAILSGTAALPAGTVQQLQLSLGGFQP